MKLIVVAGARPNFMKVAPLMWEISRRPEISAALVHTGQHYDEKMSKLFFEQLNIPRPDVDLEVGSASHAVQTAEVMKRIEPVLMQDRPDAIVVVGDVDSTVACALTASKLGIPVAHVEVGLRSRDRTMPEEINRIVTDAISHWLFVSEPSGVENLRHEGVAEDRVFFVGNVMIDTLVALRKKFDHPEWLNQLGLRPREYAVVTLYCPANVDDPNIFGGLLRALEAIQSETPLIFPVHPRTRKVLESRQFELRNLRLMEPFGYLEFMNLVTHSKFVLTDSGGIQEETTYLGIPCLTLRNNTERPITTTSGKNVLVGLDPDKIIAASRTAGRLNSARDHRPPVQWDGLASKRIMDVLAG